jgi:hypothetical protein
MQNFTNLKRVKRLSLISRVLLFGGLGIMGLALLLNFQNPESNFQLVILMAIAGIVMFQIGMPMQNRWSREPRLDQILDEATKGLDQRYALFHYLLGVDHALISPSGIYAVIPRVDQGIIQMTDEGNLTLEKSSGGLLRRSSKPKTLNLDSQLQKEAERLQRTLERRFVDSDGYSVQPYLIFIHPETTVQTGESDYPISHLKKFKSDLRKIPKAVTLSDADFEELVEEMDL